MDGEEAELLASFLLPMLHYYPDSRATAAEMVKHKWLDGVIVQGEVEMAAVARAGSARGVSAQSGTRQLDIYRQDSSDDDVSSGKPRTTPRGENEF